MSGGYAERLSSLTKREREVLELLVAGNTNREVAKVLGICFRTVEVHRENIMAKLEVSGPIELGYIVGFWEGRQ